MVDGGKLSAARDRPKTFRGIRRGISAGDGEKQKEKKKKKKRKKKETKGEKRTICQNASRLLPFTNRFTYTHSLSFFLSRYYVEHESWAMIRGKGIVGRHAVNSSALE